jgi:hypothetical protein
MLTVALATTPASRGARLAQRRKPPDKINFWELIKKVIIALKSYIYSSRSYVLSFHSFFY